MPRKKCCICVTGSSSSWRKSDSLESAFARVFGPEAEGRSGFICGACRFRCQAVQKSIEKSASFVTVGHREHQTGKKKKRYVLPGDLHIYRPIMAAEQKVRLDFRVIIAACIKIKLA